MTARLVAAHPIVPGGARRHLEWCAEVKERRDDFARSRRRAGITGHAVWTHVEGDLAVVRIDGDDPLASLAALARSDDPFDRWYAERERAIHGGPLLADGPAPTCLVEYVDGEADDLDMFIAVAVPLLPGQTEPYRRSVEHSDASGEGLARLRMWGMQRLTIWLQHLPDRDVVLYDGAGDLVSLMDSLATSDEPLVAAERELIRGWFGIDLAAENWPFPTAALAWSDEAR